MPQRCGKHRGIGSADGVSQQGRRIVARGPEQQAARKTVSVKCELIFVAAFFHFNRRQASPFFNSKQLLGDVEMATVTERARRLP